MRNSSQARSAAQSAPLIPRGVSVALSSARRRRMEAQRDTIGAWMLRISAARYWPCSLPKASGSNPRVCGVSGPMRSSDRRALSGRSYLAFSAAISSGVSASSAALPALSPSAALKAGSSGCTIGTGGGATGVVGVGAGVPLGAGGAGRDGRGAGVSGASPNPGGSSDSGACCATTGKVRASAKLPSAHLAFPRGQRIGLTDPASRRG